MVTMPPLPNNCRSLRVSSALGASLGASLGGSLGARLDALGRRLDASLALLVLVGGMLGSSTV
jgi:hypothetical protein